MTLHCDPEVLALAAVDESPLSPPDQEHLAVCDQCATELESLRSVVATGRAATGTTLIGPPPTVWQGIDAALADTGPAQVAPVVPLARAARSESRWNRWLPVGVAAGIGLMLGALATGVVTAGQDSVPADVQVVAQAQLAALPDSQVTTVGSGTAAFEKDAAGNDLLLVDTSDLEQPSGFYQVWLIDPKTSGMISLGTIGSGAQTVTFPVPAGIDPDVFSVVDISDEPIDGDPTHSKVSILRGELAT